MAFDENALNGIRKGKKQQTIENSCTRTSLVIYFFYSKLKFNYWENMMANARGELIMNLCIAGYSTALELWIFEIATVDATSADQHSLYRFCFDWLEMNNKRTFWTSFCPIPLLEWWARKIHLIPKFNEMISLECVMPSQRNLVPSIIRNRACFTHFSEEIRRRRNTSSPKFFKLIPWHLFHFCRYTKKAEQNERKKRKSTWINY